MNELFFTIILTIYYYILKEVIRNMILLIVLAFELQKLVTLYT